MAVFPSTDFPRIVVGIDNGVSPINQMQVMVTRPDRGSDEQRAGLDTCRSTTSRGSGEVSLFFNWNVDMFQTLEYVNAALARVQPSLPPTAKLTANRMTFAALMPILAYSLTSDTMSQSDLWELANYTIKPRLNRVNGVSMVVLQGGNVPEFQIEPDPAKLYRRSDGAGDSGRRGEKQHDRLAGPNREQSRALADAGQRAGARSFRDREHRRADHARPALPVRIGDIATVHPSVMPVYTIVTANGSPPCC